MKGDRDLKKRRKLIAGCLLLALVVGLIQPLCNAEIYQAATSYTNAKEFYDSTTKKDVHYHTEAVYGRVYYATQAKLASSSTNTKYHTVGFDVTLSGNGRSVSFTVQREGGSMTQVNSQKDGKYEYILYTITEDKLFELATQANSTNAAYVLSASTINVRMDAIMTTKVGNSIKGGIAEDGRGGFTPWGKVYRLKDSSDLKKMKEIFSGHEFKSYKDIKVTLENFLLQLRYNVLGLNPTGSAPKLGNENYSYNSQGILQKGNSIYTDSSRTVNKISILNTSLIGLSKTGYHLKSGNEWVTNNLRYFASNSTHQSTSIDPEVSYKNHALTLYANWKPNTYTIAYNANGGSGIIMPTAMVYDTGKTLSSNTFKRTGYAFAGWNTKADGSGTTYSNQNLVNNLTDVNGGTVVLYAQWKPCVYKITTDKQMGTGGTDAFFEKFEYGFYSDKATKNAICKLVIPSKIGYDFIGYYSWINGGGIRLVNSVGDIEAENSFFLDDTTIYANWKPKQFKLTFDMQGGTQGTTNAVATYDALYPMDRIAAPVRQGYRFMGYFTEINGTGELIYNEFMATDKIYQETTDQTLYAYWIDDGKPEITLSGGDDWTNQEVVLMAEASDYGSGLDRVQIYLLSADGSEILVAEEKDLDGIKAKQLFFTNRTEGATRYKAVATDIEGNTAESYNTVLYDITAPAGEVIEVEIDGDAFYFEIDITDINMGD